MENSEVPEGESDNPKGDPDDETSGEDTLETHKGGEALERIGRAFSVIRAGDLADAPKWPAK
jgi:hypothetical protein